ETDVPILVPQTDTKEQEPAPLSQISTSELLTQSTGLRAYMKRWYYLEFNRRFALPTACIVLALVGIPLGLSSKKGGKSTGFVLTIILVFAYYSASLIGVSLARQGRVSPPLGVWLSDILFFLGGAFLLWQAERRPFEIASVKAWLAKFKRSRRTAVGEAAVAPARESAFDRAATRFR